jgi:hypothetical protein
LMTTELPSKTKMEEMKVVRMIVVRQAVRLSGTQNRLHSL